MRLATRTAVVSILAALSLPATAGTLRTFSAAERWETGTFLPCNGCTAAVASGSFQIAMPASPQQNVAGGLSRMSARDLRGEAALLVLVRALDRETADAAPYLIVELDSEQGSGLAAACSALYKLDGLTPGAWSLVSVPIAAVECNVNFGIQDLRRVNLIQVQVYSDGSRSLSLEVGAVGTIR